MHPIRHFLTITKHHNVVCHYCFKLGLYWQGLTHDLSKYSFDEFIPGATYFTGTCSPHEADRKDHGYSRAWMHHKGRNKHHFEYWTDIDETTFTYEPVPMPNRYLKEMLCDRIGACKIYLKDKYNDGSAYAYLVSHYPDKHKMHPKSVKTLESWLLMLKEKGEQETFAYIKKNYPN